MFIERSPSSVTKIIERAVGGMRVERPGLEMHALGANVVGEDLAELIVGDLAEIGGLAAEARHARRRIAGAAAGSFERRPHARIEKFGSIGIDQVHRALDDAVVDQEIIVAARDDIDDRIADRQHVETRHQKVVPVLVIAGIR